MNKKVELGSPGSAVRREVELLETGNGDEILVSSFVPDGHSGAAVVICSGLFNDVSRNYRREHLLSRALSESGVSSTRFDYVGTSNSGRSDRHVSFESMTDDTRCVVQHVLDTHHAQRVGLLGTRIGAIVAATAAGSDPTAPLALWDPVVDGSQYLRDGIRAYLMSQLRRADGSRTSSAELLQTLTDGGHIDLLGYELDRDLHESISGMVLSDAVGHNPRSILLAQFSRREKLHAPYEQLITNWRQDGSAVTPFVFDRDEPWWFNVDLATVEDIEGSAERLVKSTATWFAGELLPGGETR